MTAAAICASARMVSWRGRADLAANEEGIKVQLGKKLS
jgi:hypothetical protein